MLNLDKIKLEKQRLDGIEVPLRNGGVAIIDPDDQEKIESFPWRNVRGYAVAQIWHKYGPPRSCITVLMHRLINNTPKGKDTDHINCVKLDNRKHNLRTCNDKQNGRNKLPYRNNTSGYKGVSWYKPYKKWTAFIIINYKQKNLGYFDTIEEARDAYRNAAVAADAEFARW